MIDVEAYLTNAVRLFWQIRQAQSERQGGASGVKDAGNRGAVTGGKHADGFVQLLAAVVKDAGLLDAHVHVSIKRHRTLPGYFRPTKEWDVVVTAENDLVAAIEVKSQVGSFGNNFNNRVEEALGNAMDFSTAYRKGSFSPSGRPWLGYFFMLEEHARSMRSTKRITLQPFPVDEAFQGLSYAQRYELMCLRLVREGLYDAVCFFTSRSTAAADGYFTQPNRELGIRPFAVSLHARAAAFASVR